MFLTSSFKGLGLPINLPKLYLSHHWQTYMQIYSTKYSQTESNNTLKGSYTTIRGFSGGSDGKESAINAGHPGSNPELEKSPEEENGKPLQYSCLGNPMDTKAW